MKKDYLTLALFIGCAAAVGAALWQGGQTPAKPAPTTGTTTPGTGTTGSTPTTGTGTPTSGLPATSTDNGLMWPGGSPGWQHVGDTSATSGGTVAGSIGSLYTAPADGGYSTQPVSPVLVTA